jgi:predicted ATP-dependent serine protease
MSENEAEFKAAMAALAKEEEKKRQIQARRLIIDDAKTAAQVDMIQRNQEEMEIVRNLSFGPLSDNQIGKLRKANTEYIEAARHSMTFMNDAFKNVIPFFQKNLILIGGKTGEGKSTTVANIAFSTMKQVNPQTGKNRRVLVLTNEEKAEDVYNRVTCLIKGWAYTNHNLFTDEQIKTFDEYLPKLAADGRLSVYENEHEGITGLTTTVEGICQIFENLIKAKEFYDVIIIDYYQNIKHSKLDPSLDEFKVQAKLSAMLDIYKNVYPAPIVLMSQVNPPDEKNTPFQYRIKGRKIIMDVATCVLEMVADRESYRTEWSIHKSRFNESVGKGFFTGFDKGRYLPYDKEFISLVARMKEARMYNKIGVATKEDKAAGAKMNELMGKKDETK